ncbi:MAG: hypothetical protein IKG42_06470 [Clostridia bacterium]|nr:hypothetical protein [Clostridia bacterium]
MDENKVKTIKKYGFIAFIIIMIIIVIFLMVRYQVEGEKNVPYEISNIIIQGTIDGKSNQTENVFDIDLSQNNDIYIYLEKNDNYKKELEIKSVKIEDLEIVENNKLGDLKVLLPTENEVEAAFVKSEEDYLGKTIKYVGDIENNMKEQKISKKGGVVVFRISNSNIGHYVSNNIEDGAIVEYSKLIKELNINEKDLKFKVKMDIVIETSNDSKFKTTIELDLPTEDFGDNGVIQKKIKDCSDYIYKRV